MKSRYEWLASLNVGDKVIVQECGWLPGKTSIGEVTRATKTLYLVNYRGIEGRFRMHDGVEPGNGYRKARITEYTEDAAMQSRLQHARDRLSVTNWQKVPDDIVLEMESCLQRTDGA